MTDSGRAIDRRMLFKKPEGGSEPINVLPLASVNMAEDYSDHRGGSGPNLVARRRCADGDQFTARGQPSRQRNNGRMLR